MDDLKKRKLEEASNGGISSSPEELKVLLDPLSKSQLVDLLSKLYVFKFNSLFSFVFVVLLFVIRHCVWLPRKRRQRR